jgi:hypothetical protein
MKRNHQWIATACQSTIIRIVMTSRFRRPMLVLVLSTTMVLHVLGQGTFQNLDFEWAIPLGLGYALTSDALPYWSAYPSACPYAECVLTDTRYMDSAGVSLHDVYSRDYRPIQGIYSVFLQGPSIYVPTNSMYAQSAYIAQSGTIPANSKSLIFDWSPGSIIQVSFNGQIIPLVQLGLYADYNVVGGDISSLVGQYGELRFTAARYMGGVIDDIRFSVQPVPEPGTFCLFGLGAMLLGWRRWRR